MGRSAVVQILILFAIAKKWVGRARKTLDQLALYEKFLKCPDIAVLNLLPSLAPVSYKLVSYKKKIRGLTKS